jgi:hypothetical protein
VAARHYVHFTETHVAAGFGKFEEYHIRSIGEGLAAAFPQTSEAVQYRENGSSPGGRNKPNLADVSTVRVVGV